MIMCSNCEILTFYEKCCDLVDAWLAGELVPKELSVLEDYVLNSGVFGNQEYRVASALRKKNGFKHILHRFWLEKSVLVSEYPELKIKPYLLPACQTKRWMRLLNPKKREQIRKEIANVRTMKPETIDSFDKLLVSLGL